MPRRREVEKRDILPDPKFNNKLVAKFVNSLLKKGKKSVAESILYGAFDIIENSLVDIQCSGAHRKNHARKAVR